MRIGSLFSGIGGLELGLEWAGLGEAVWQVEQNEKSRNSLAEHWPDAERFDDVRTVGRHNLEPVDLICGGFPCQDVSSAGKRAGLGGARSGLWFEFARIVSELRPRWVVVENVASGAALWVDAVRVELERLGYVSLPIPISAADCGGWHERDRVFIVAHLDGELLRDKPRGRRRQTGESKAKPSPVASDADGIRESRLPSPEQQGGNWTCDMGRIWAAEPDVARVVHGLPGRVDRERALGLSVVPQCAQVVGEVIKLMDTYL